MPTPDPPRDPEPRAANRSLPRGVVALGVVSLLMDTSSEMIHGLLPVFLMGTLGASATLVGLLDGAAEATAAAMKLVSGVISDRVGRRKPLLLLGYGLAALTKPVFALADTVAQILAARVVDRVGKGIRGTPRDALIADITPADRRGAAYGLRQSLDTVGALAGPLVALLLLAAGGDVRLVFAVAVAPAALAVAVLALGVSEPPPREPHRPRPFPIRRAELGRLPACYWGTVGLAVALTFARLSEAFLVLASTRAGWTTAESPWVLVAMNATYALTAWPAGRLSDRLPRARLLMWGTLHLAVGNLLLAFADDTPRLIAGLLLWGVHMGLSQGLLSALVADATPADLRGTAFGVLQAAMAVALFAAAALAGLLWDHAGPQVMWGTGAGLALLCAVTLVVIQHRRPADRPPVPPVGA
jgi:MFS family permease